MVVKTVTKFKQYLDDGYVNVLLALDSLVIFIIIRDFLKFSSLELSICCALRLAWNVKSLVLAGKTVIFLVVILPLAIGLIRAIYQDQGKADRFLLSKLRGLAILHIFIGLGIGYSIMSSKSMEMLSGFKENPALQMYDFESWLLSLVDKTNLILVFLITLLAAAIMHRIVLKFPTDRKCQR